MTVAPVPGNGLPLFQARRTALVVIKLQLNCLDKGRRELSERCSKISALMSALGQKRTLAISFDQLVAERLGGLEVQEQLNFS